MHYQLILGSNSSSKEKLGAKGQTQQKRRVGDNSITKSLVTSYRIKMKKKIDLPNAASAFFLDFFIDSKTVLE